MVFVGEIKGDMLESTDESCVAGWDTPRTGSGGLAGPALRNEDMAERP
jgi:hypothetical protein